MIWHVFKYFYANEFDDKEHDHEQMMLLIRMTVLITTMMITIIVMLSNDDYNVIIPSILFSSHFQLD